MKRQKNTGQTFSNLEFISSINKYIPSLVLQHMISRQERLTLIHRKAGKSDPPPKVETKLPELQPMETVCLFADISGFTNLSEMCASKGVRGNEELAFCINRYMEGMVKNLGKYGGDIIKFVGDAMIVMWPPPIENDLETREQQKQELIRRAIQCALDIQREMGNLKILDEVPSLSVKIGIGYGKCALLYVGGVFNRAEFFTVGEALKLALKSEGQAEGGGEIIVAAQALDCVKQNYMFEERPTSKGEMFYRVIKLIGEGAKTRADAQMLRSQFRPDFFTNAQQQLRSWVPAAIIPYLQIGAESFGSETRSLTVMFLSLGIDLSSADTLEGMQKIQKIVVTVQQQIYRLQGSVNKLVMDDKGSTFICLWGVCPLSHEDDAARAILTGFNIARELDKIDKTKCHIGISSGEVFSGVVGTSGSRKEFSVLGDVVNLAARIMGSLKYSDKYTMCCDMNTRNLASNYFHFNYVAHKEFKGKSISIPVFEPIDPSFVPRQAIEKGRIYAPDAMLYTHSNPLILDRSNNTKKRNKAFGTDHQLMDLTDKLLDFNKCDYANQPFMAVIKGEVGSGKTLFALNLIEAYTNSDDFKMRQQSQGKMPPIYSSSLNAETELQFLNIWRPVLQMMMIHICKRENMRKDKVLRLILNASSEESNAKMIDLFCDILGVEKKLIESKFPKKLLETPQIKPKVHPFPFVSRPDYDEKSEIIELLLVFFKIAIGETEDVSVFNTSQFKSEQRRKGAKGTSPDNSSVSENERPVTMIILDNAHMMDQASWQFFEAIRDDCYRVAIILCMETDENDKIKISNEVLPVFSQIWYSQAMEDLYQIDMPFFEKQQLEQLIIECGEKYKQTYMDEISKMTEVLDPATSIKPKDPKVHADWFQRLFERWQLRNIFKSVNEEILFTILKKSSGNPLICLGLFTNMLHGGIIRLENGAIVKTPEFEECQRLANWNSVPVPRLALKQNCNRIDAFITQVRDNPKKRPGDLELCITSIVLLKAAVVLGDEFELQALKKVQPLQRIGSEKMVLNCLKFLEQYELIEILDETDKKNVLCRFSKNFLRESLYQILLYRECKQQLHTAAADYLQNSALSIQQNPEIEANKLKQQMMKAQDITDEKQLSYQSRTALIVRRIQNQLIRQPNEIVLNETIYKAARSHGEMSKRLCCITSKHFRWYHNTQELRSGCYLGSVPLINLISCIPTKSKDGTKSGFSINSTLCYDRNLQAVSNEKCKDIEFFCDTELTRDEWVISIDFLKTRAMYEDYANKNIPVQFPIRSTEEEKVEENDTNNINELLFDFATKLRGKTILASSNPQAEAKMNLARMQSIGPSFGGRHNSKRVSLMQSEDRGSQITAQDLMPRLKLLYNSAIVAFTHHVSQKACKFSILAEQQKLGQLPERALYDFARTTSQIMIVNQSEGGISPGPQSRGSITSPDLINKLSPQQSPPTSYEKERTFTDKLMKRRHSSISAKEPRRETATFQKNNHLIQEEDSAEEASQDYAEKKKPTHNHQPSRHRDSEKRRSQSINDPSQITLIQESNSKSDEDISNQIRKISKENIVQTPLSSAKQNSPHLPKAEKSISNPSSADRFDQARDPGQTFAAQERPVSKNENNDSKKKWYSPHQAPNLSKMQNQDAPKKDEKQAMLQGIEESSIHQNPASEYNDFPNDLNLSEQRDSKDKKQFQSMPKEGVNITSQPYKSLQASKHENYQSSNTDLVTSLERLIQSQIGKGLSEIMAQNQMMIETQQKQINQQMQLLNQSLAQNQLLIQHSIQSKSNLHSNSPVRSPMLGTVMTSRRGTAVLETPIRVQTEESDFHDDQQIQEQFEPSLRMSEIKQLYQDYPPMMQQHGTTPDRHRTRQQAQNPYKQPIRQDQIPEPKKSELGAATAKYMQRLFKKQIKLQQQQVAIQEEQMQQQQYFPLPEHMWDDELARKPHEIAKYAKALKKCQCQLVGDLMEVPAGAKVRIVERVDEIQMYRLRYNKRVGLFMMKDFKPIVDQAQSLMPTVKQQSMPVQNSPNTSIESRTSSANPQNYQSQAPGRKEPDKNINYQQTDQTVKSQPKEKREPQAPPRKNFFQEKGKFDYLY